MGDLHLREGKPVSLHHATRLALCENNQTRGRLHPLGRMAQGERGDRMNLDPHEEESIIGSVWLVLIVLILWIIYGGTA